MDKPVSILSGGEKARLALSGVLLARANTLLLDEPGNHLDMESVEALIDALQDFEGSFVLVAHDRYLLEQVCNKVWYVMDGKIHVFPGTFADFSERLGEPWKPTATRQSGGQALPEMELVTATGYQDQKELKRRLAKAERECKKTEEELAGAEEKKSWLLQQMSNPDTAQDFQKVQELQQILRQTEQAISALLPLWESQLQEIESLNQIR